MMACPVSVTLQYKRQLDSTSSPDPSPASVPAITGHVSPCIEAATAIVNGSNPSAYARERQTPVTRRVNQGGTYGASTNSVAVCAIQTSASSSGGIGRTDRPQTIATMARRAALTATKSKARRPGGRTAVTGWMDRRISSRSDGPGSEFGCGRSATPMY